MIEDKDIIIQQQQDIISLMKTPMIVVVPGVRDQFAMAALTGLLSDPERDAEPSEYAECAYEYADAMLAARGQKK
jgi:hypothetical protein